MIRRTNEGLTVDTRFLTPVQTTSASPLKIEPAYLFTIFLVFVRIGGLMVAAPVFNHMAIPVRIRIFLAVLMAYILVGFVPGPLPPNIGHPVAFILAVCI